MFFKNSSYRPAVLQADYCLEFGTKMNKNPEVRKRLLEKNSQMIGGKEGGCWCQSAEVNKQVIRVGYSLDWLPVHRKVTESEEKKPYIYPFIHKDSKILD